MSATRASLAHAAAVALVVLAGCAPLGTRESMQYHVLDIAPKAAARAQAPRAKTLLVLPMVAASFYDAQEIAYSRAPGTRAYYVLHAWAERPARRITQLLAARLEQHGGFETIATASTGVRGDLMLVTTLDDFYHEAMTAAGSVRVRITAEVTDPRRRVLVSRRVFEATAAVPSEGAGGAVQAFGAAVTAALDDLCAWVETAAPR